MKRVFALIAAASGLMFADLICLVMATNTLHIPWLIRVFYWPLGWPLFLYDKVTNKNPSSMVVVLFGLLDFALLYAILSFIERRWRRNRGVVTA